MLRDLGQQPRWTDADQQLANYWTWFLDTPAYSHAAYAGLALALAGLLLWRRSPADVAVAAMLLAGLAFTASFFVVSIACDYRYLYFADLAAIAGAIYFAADPSLKRASQAAATSSRGRRAATKR
ncbi:MAG: hypothetical protein JWO33_622, partial [Caulobacteraceae bacterium]|nr:hypothetical protein [Caulobacteraceae bacterium]